MTRPTELDPSVTIRAATPADQRALGRLAAALVQLHHEFEPRRFIIYDNIDEGYGRFLVTRIDADGTVLRVAETPELGVVGYVWASTEKRDWNRLLDTHGKIHDILVDPRARRRGIARALIQAAIDGLKALGAKRIVAETAAKNLEAQQLFKSFGFGPTLIEHFLPVD